jgi:hypothetical protein
VDVAAWGSGRSRRTLLDGCLAPLVNLVAIGVALTIGLFWTA